MIISLCIIHVYVCSLTASNKRHLVLLCRCSHGLHEASLLHLVIAIWLGPKGHQQLPEAKLGRIVVGGLSQVWLLSILLWLFSPMVCIHCKAEQSPTCKPSAPFARVMLTKESACCALMWLHVG